MNQQLKADIHDLLALREICPYLVRVRVRFSGPHSVRMWENMDQKNSEYGHISRSVMDTRR